MWEKVLLNLLSNAFKFTFDGEIAVSVARRAGRQLALVGCATPASAFPRTSCRGCSSASIACEGAQGRSFEGSGIGLALVQELVKLHGGEIAVESTVGQGTTLHRHAALRPRPSAGRPGRRRRRSRDRRRAGAGVCRRGAALAARCRTRRARRAICRSDDRRASCRSARGGAGKRILLADDNADMRAYVRRLLDAQGYEVEAVADGEAALASAQRQAPDLILTDVMMPRLDGFGLLRAIRAESDHGRRPDHPAVGARRRGGEGRGPGRRRRRLSRQAVRGARAAWRGSTPTSRWPSCAARPTARSSRASSAS